MKQTIKLLLPALMLAASAHAQKLHDGPYLFHENGLLVARSVTDGQLKTDTIQRKDALQVTFPANPDWNFSVNLRDTLTIEPCILKKTPKKVLFLSDVEGEFAALRSLLLANGVIDSKYNWTFGKGRVVLCGDLFDRGDDVTEVLWLLYKLEQDAKKKGGYVHTILGNHDIMNMSGDVRYVDQKYFDVAKVMNIDYMKFYDTNTELGRWLRTKNTVEKVGDNLCAHAGVAPQINTMNMTLQEINDKCRPYYDKAQNKEAVSEAGLDNFFSGKTSLFWYRGYFKEPKATEAEVNATLALYGVKRIIVGHTIVPGNVGFYYDKKVLGIDVNQHKGDHQAALKLKKKWYKVDNEGKRTEI